ncbi:hypothetical protein N9D80_03490 [Flavobacteriales bacterium]|nr:hypothetical protein [Flavobacteriales bacterium]
MSEEEKQQLMVADEARQQEEKSLHKKQKQESQTIKFVLLLSVPISLCVFFSSSGYDRSIIMIFSGIAIYSLILYYPVFWVIKFKNSLIKSARFILFLLIMILMLYFYMQSYIPGPRPEIFQYIR